MAVHYPAISSTPEGNPPTSIRYEYAADNLSMLEGIADRANLLTRFSYNRRMDRVAELAAWGSTKTFGVDPYGRRTSVTNGLEEVTHNVFDQFSNVTVVINPDHVPAVNERVTQRFYDPYGNMLKEWGASTFSASSAYDLDGNKISLTDGNGNTMRWAYDGRNRLMTMIDPNLSQTRVEYDNNGNQTKIVDPTGRETQVWYNPSNLRVKLKTADGIEIRYEYDKFGRRTSMVDATGTNRWTYDRAGRVIANHQDNVSCSLYYTYDSHGHRTNYSIVPRAGGLFRVNYKYDYAGRIDAVEEVSHQSAIYRYTWSKTANRIVGVQYPSGFQVAYSIDPLLRVNSMSLIDQYRNPIQTYKYEYNSSGNRTGEKALDRYEVYEYDAKRQLVAWRGGQNRMESTKVFGQSYLYDLNGNQTNVFESGTSTIIEINNLNQPTLVRGETLKAIQHDANGNLVKEGDNSFGYNSLDQLTELRYGNRGIALAYDGIGRVVKVTDGSTLDLESRVYDGLLPVLHFGSDMTKAKKVHRGLDLSGTMFGLGGVGGVLGVSDPDNLMEYVSDSRGHVRLVNSVKGIELIDYSPFGRFMGADVGLPLYGFGSREGLLGGRVYVFPSRAYYPYLGRWMSRDKAGPVDGPNLYVYARNNPISMVDAYGFIAVGIDGTCSEGGFGCGDGSIDMVLPGRPGWLECGNGGRCNSNVKNLVADWAGPGTGLYFGGPSLYGAGLESSVQTGYRSVCDALKNNPSEPIYLFGHSRGGMGALMLAERLCTKGCGDCHRCVKIKFMGLYDAVDRYGPRSIGKIDCVESVVHAQRSNLACLKYPWMCRIYFGNTGLRNNFGPNVSYREQEFYGTHGAIGGSGVQGDIEEEAASRASDVYIRLGAANSGARLRPNGRWGAPLLDGWTGRVFGPSLGSR